MLCVGNMFLDVVCIMSYVGSESHPNAWCSILSKCKINGDSLQSIEIPFSIRSMGGGLFIENLNDVCE